MYVAFHTNVNASIKVLVHMSQKIMFGIVTSLMGKTQCSPKVLGLIFFNQGHVRKTHTFFYLE
jgi:hypothetical protein